MPSRYAGRNQIPLYAAAGRRTETDGGSARYRGRGEGYSFRLGSIRNETRSRQGGSLRRNSDSCHLGFDSELVAPLFLTFTRTFGGQ